MKSIFISLVTLFASVSSASLLPYSQAVELAKKENKKIVVIWNGSDWSPNAVESTKVFDEKAQALDNEVIFAVYDDKNGMTEAELKAPKPPGDMFKIPAIQIISPDNSIVYFSHQKLTPEKVVKVMEKMPLYLDDLEEAEALWKKADAVSGAAAAKLYGEGLDFLQYDAAQGQKAIIEKMQKADPADSDGYILKYTFGHEGFMNQLAKIARGGADEKDFKGSLDWSLSDAYIDKCLTYKHLPIELRQKILAAKFSTQRQRDNMPAALATLKEIVALDPKSQLGIGAANYYDFYTKPVYLKELKYTGQDMRPRFSPWIMDVSKIITEPGTYEIERKGGGVDTRNMQLFSGKAIIVDVPEDQKDKNTSQFTIELPANTSMHQLELHVEAIGHGWYDGSGEFVITKKK